jgi:MinD superfamily P-loop ATPase
VVVNKADINPENAKKIRRFCSERGIEVLGELPYDDSATKAMIEEETLIEYGKGPLVSISREIWERMEALIGDGEGPT